MFALHSVLAVMLASFSTATNVESPSGSHEEPHGTALRETLVPFVELRFLAGSNGAGIERHVGTGDSKSPLESQAPAVAILRPESSTRAISRRIDANPRDEHLVLQPDGFDLEHAASFVTATTSSAQPFHDLLTSWNFDAPTGTGFTVEIAVKSANDPWSDWLFVGDWGDVPVLPKATTCDGGKVDTDFFRGEKHFDAARVRVRAFAKDGAAKREVAIDRLALCFSDRDAKTPCSRAAPSSRPAIALDVPFRSQRTDKPEIAGRICSPTSLSMVLAYRGVDRPTGDVAARAYDAANDIYGNWPRNVQAAYSFGVPGYLTRFACWSDVEDMLAIGQPVIASIGVKEGELAGAPYAKTGGHLIVITGFDADGSVRVNDPAATDAAKGVLVYRRADMQKVWLDRGGTAYVLTRP